MRRLIFTKVRRNGLYDLILVIQEQKFIARLGTFKCPNGARRLYHIYDGVPIYTRMNVAFAPVGGAFYKVERLTDILYGMASRYNAALI